MEAADVDAFIKEAGMLQRLSGCPQVVSLHGACVVDQSLAVVMELVEVGLHAACTWRCAGKRCEAQAAAPRGRRAGNAAPHVAFVEQ